MRRTHDQVRVETRIEERAGMIAHLTRHRAGVALAVRGGRMTLAEAELVNRAVAAFAENCAIGLHVESETCSAVRDAMRPLVKELGRG